MKQKKKEPRYSLPLSGAFEARDDTTDNVSRFHARLESGRDGGEVAVFGEGWSEAESTIEANPLIDYRYGDVPHIEFANLNSLTARGRDALGFLSQYGPLCHSHYLRRTPRDVARWQEEGFGEPRRFRTPLKEFWEEQKRFTKLVELWSQLSAKRSREEAAAGRLAEEMNSILAGVHPDLEVSETGNVVAGYAADLLTSLYLCLWMDIAAGRVVRRCADGHCYRFFRPSRETQTYHSSVCLRRKTQREYVRAKRARAKKRTARRR